jgi:hypothetical protein
MGTRCGERGTDGAAAHPGAVAPEFLLIGRPLTHPVQGFSSELGLPRQSTCEPLTHRSRRSSGEFPTWIAEPGEITLICLKTDQAYASQRRDTLTHSLRR